LVQLFQTALSACRLLFRLIRSWRSRQEAYFHSGFLGQSLLVRRHTSRRAKSHAPIRLSDPRVVIQWPAGLAPSLKAQFEREFTKYRDELRELLRP
jgi:hypothetical protein